jgi:hypothetical protein
MPSESLEWEDWLQMGAAVLALVLAAAAGLAWRRRPTRRTVLVALAFGLFAVRGLLLMAGDLVASASSGDVLEGLAVPLEAAFLVLLTAVLLRD